MTASTGIETARVVHLSRHRHVGPTALAMERPPGSGVRRAGRSSATARCRFRAKGGVKNQLSALGSWLRSAARNGPLTPNMAYQVVGLAVIGLHVITQPTEIVGAPGPSVPRTGIVSLRHDAAVDDVRGQLTPYLLSDEVLLWTGRPDPTKHLSRIDIFMVPFSLMWGGFAIFWESGVLVSGAPVLFALFGLPFVGIGLYFIFGRFIVKARRKRQTAYGLTDHRALVALGAGALSETPVQHQPIDQRRSRDGKHLTVTFGRPASGSFAGSSFANTGMEFFDRGNLPLAFYDVPDVVGLESALRRVGR